MFKSALVSMLLALVVACSATSNLAESDQPVYDIRSGSQMRLKELVPYLLQQKIVIVGEHHNNEDHHWAQLRVIQALKDAGADVAVGLEMFRSDSQSELDRWVAGETSENAFEQVYYDNWNFPWPLYGDMLEFARDEKIPVVGLNVSKGITRQVAKGGFQSLDAKQRKALPMVSCHVDENYMNFIKESYGMHGHGQLDFTYFCEAQLVWDKAMAVHIIDYLYRHPYALMVVIAGKGHAQKMGIPAQVRKRSALPYAVMLPQLPQGLVTGGPDETDADYLFLSP